MLLNILVHKATPHSKELTPHKVLCAEVRKSGSLGTWLYFFTMQSVGQTEEPI